MEADDYLTSVDDDLATSVARSMGYVPGTYRDVRVQDYQRLPEFGPRKIHSTREIEPDPLQGAAHSVFVTVDPGAFAQMWTRTKAWVNVNGGGWQLIDFSGGFQVAPGQSVVFGGIDYTATWVAVPSTSRGPYLTSRIRQSREHTATRDHKPPQWKAKFHERRPTEPQKAGRPKRKRK